MMFMEYTSPWGDTFPLLTADVPRVQVDATGIQGLVGEAEDSVVTAPTSHGQVLDGLLVGPMTGTLTGRVHASSPEECERLYYRWRSAWDRRKPGVLRAGRDDGMVFHTKVRASSVMAAADRDPLNGIETEFTVQVVADKGLWFGDEVSGEGSVEVTNSGDVAIYPHIRWEGAGGQVTLPSGAVFTLPAVTGERTLLLDDEESLAVEDAPGHTDYDIWPIDGAVAEGVPVGKTRHYTLPAGATLVWQTATFDPWE